jgi:hypothetical protein
VFEDVVVCDGTAEVAKVARLITKMHLNAKLLTDYDDKHNIPPVFMNIGTLQTVTDFDKHLKDQITLEQSLQAHDEKEADEIVKTLGTGMMEVANGKSITGSQKYKVPPTPLDEETDDEDDKPSTKRPVQSPETTDSPDAPVTGMVVPCEMGMRSYYDGTNNLMVLTGTPTHKKLRRLRFEYYENIYVFRVETGSEATWLLDALLSVGVGVVKRAEWDKYIARKLPKGPKIKAKLPGKIREGVKPKYGNLKFEHNIINDKSYVTINTSDVNSSVREAMRKIDLAGTTWKLMRQAGYHYEGVGTSKTLFNLLRQLRLAGYAVSNPDEFKKMVDKFFPGKGSTAVSMVEMPTKSTTIKSLRTKVTAPKTEEIPDLLKKKSKKPLKATPPSKPLVKKKIKKTSSAAEIIRRFLSKHKAS